MLKWAYPPLSNYSNNIAAYCCVHVYYGKDVHHSVQFDSRGVYHNSLFSFSLQFDTHICKIRTSHLNTLEQYATDMS